MQGKYGTENHILFIFINEKPVEIDFTEFIVSLHTV